MPQYEGFILRGLIMSFVDYNSLAFKSCEDINKYSSEFKNIGFTAIDYVRVYHKDRARIHLGNNSKWLAKFYSNYYKSNELFFEKSSKLIPQFWTSFVNLWNSHPNKSVIKQIQDECNIGNGITLAYSGNNYDEFFYLGTDVDNTCIYQNYIDKIDKLKNLCFTFKDNARTIIKHGELNKISPPTCTEACLHTVKSISLDMKLVTDATDQLKRYFIGDIYITIKERDIIRWIIDGKSSLDISCILNISQRTVEAHISNVKSKLNCKKITQVIYLLTKYGVL